ncbi:MAG: DUF1343 domain-containing protein [Bacillota bacterium]|nr:DUF1343 domain-containing protein [Bacillota bacterium]
MVRCGIDNEAALSRALRGRKAGVITNHTGLDASHTPVALALVRRYGVRVVRLFSPEHGMWGDVQDLDSVADTVEPLTGLPVTSLFGPSLSPPKGSLKGIDTLVFDIQDIGSRYYTFMWTMAKCVEAAARAGVKFVVLDRPNPVTGTRVEGNLSRREFSSFVGLYPCAARHGMTAGEMALYVNAEFGLGADLEVVKIEGWRRGMWFDETGLAFVPPSPNTTGLTMATLYPGTCLIEGTNLSEGRGTTQPFEVAGAPWLDPFAFAGELNSRALPGVWFRPTYFTPYAFKHNGIRCGGVQVHIADREAVSAFDLGLHMICAARAASSEFRWRNDPNTYAIDLLAGTDELRLAIDDGATPSDLERMWAPGRARFETARARCLLYSG